MLSNLQVIMFLNENYPPMIIMGFRGVTYSVLSPFDAGIYETYLCTLVCEKEYCIKNRTFLCSLKDLFMILLGMENEYLSTIMRTT